VSGPFLPDDWPVDTDSPEWSVDGDNLGGTTTELAGYDPGYPQGYGTTWPQAPPPPSEPTVVPERERWTILVRNKDRRPAAVVNDFSSATFVPRWSAVGYWQLTLPFNTLAAGELLQDQAGIIVLRDGEVMFSGFVDGDPAYENRYEDGRDMLTVNGSEDTGWLYWNVARPEPFSRTPDPSGHYATDAYWLREGICSSIFYELVNEQIGPSAIPEWKVPGLILAADKMVGGSVLVKARYGRLTDVMTRFGRESDPIIGFRIRQTDDLASGTIEFEAVESRDLTQDVVFSVPLNNLVSYTATQSIGGNYLIGAGDGTGTQRLIVERGNSAEIVQNGRRVAYAPHYDIDNKTELRTALIGDLAAQQSQTAAAFTVSTDSHFRYGRDFEVGDRVTVFVRGVQLTEVVGEVQLMFDEDNVTTEVRVGSAGAKLNPNELRLFSKIRELEGRVSPLERS
jgi:hypothetical protein